MAISAVKKEKIARKKREDYVLSVAITKSVTSPFMDHNWDQAARQFIETGNEALKAEFPSTPRKGK